MARKLREFCMNNFEVTGVITTDIILTTYTSPSGRTSYQTKFGFRIADHGAVLVPVIAFGDYAKKLEAMVYKGCKVNVWCTAMDYLGELVFCINKCVLFAYPKENEDGE